MRNNFLNKTVRKEYLFFLKFFGLYFLLVFAFRFWVGITVIGGIYSSWAAQYFDVVHWFAAFIAQSAKLFLKLLGYNAWQRTSSHLTIQHSHGINILYPCLGIYVMCFWVSFVAATTAVLKVKIRWMVAGVASIAALNILRIALIVLAYHKGWRIVTAADPHTVFNFLCYTFILLLMFFFVRSIKNITQ